MRFQALIITIIPLGDVLRDRDFPLLLQALLLLRPEKHVESINRAMARRGEDVNEFGGIDEFARSD
jgi:hypothetical protein